MRHSSMIRKHMNLLVLVDQPEIIYIGYWNDEVMDRQKICICVCVCVCVLSISHSQTHKSTHTDTH